MAMVGSELILALVMIADNLFSINVSGFFLIIVEINADGSVFEVRGGSPWCNDRFYWLGGCARGSVFVVWRWLRGCYNDPQ